MAWIVVATLVSYFMLALTFNTIGNGVSTANLVLGFTFGVLGSIIGTAAGIIFYRKKTFDILIIILISVLTVLFLLSAIFGGIAYVNDSIEVN